MKLGGFGAIEAINAVSRFDKMKSADEAKALSVSGKGTEKSAPSSTASSSEPTSSFAAKRAPKDFSRVLSDEQKSFDADQESEPSELATANAAAMQVGRAPTSRPEARPDGQSAAAEAGRNSQVAVGNPATNPKVQPQNVAGEATTASVEEKISEIVESLEQTAETELSMRHISMREFLSKMQGEFGIEPQSIVKAFANLDQATLQAPPDQTAEAVLTQLGLKPDQMPKAEGFYREMLNQTGESALNETLVGVGAGVTLKVLSEQDLAMDKLQKSISSLNDAFARRDSAGPKTPTVEVGAPLATPFASISLATAASIGPVQVDEVAELDKSAVEVAEQKEKAAESKFASIGAALTAASATLAGSAGQNAGGSGSDSKNTKQDASKPKSDGIALKEFNSIESALATSGVSVTAASEKSATPLMAGTSTAAALATAVANQNSDGSTTNAQDLVRNAQILMRNGGGEMKMQLKPEGVGEVTLKVAVKDGQVAIQMMTESDSAKKMLESNLDDLKTSLAQHKLHIDALKIEVGSDLAKQRFEQSQQDTNREQARQMAQDFMGQFRDDRQGFRQSFFDQSGFKNYRQPSQNPLPPVEPVATAAVSQSSSGERRLNLVA